MRARRGQLRQLQAAWHATVSRADNEYKRLQRELNAARIQIGQLKGEYEIALRKLERSTVERQQAAYLQSKFISEHKIESISVGRQATLASYGIETANDIEYNRVLGVPGVGPHVTNILCTWRTEMLRQFRPDRSQGVPLAERRALLLQYAQVRQQCELKLHRGPRQLRELNSALHATLQSLGEQIVTATVFLAQAEADLEVMNELRRTPRRFRPGE